MKSDDSVLHLLGCISMGSSEYIAHLEKQGQRELVLSDVLPIEIQQRETYAMYESLGFLFGAHVDNLFRQASLPMGWKKKATDHDMWSDILDEKSRKRASVFYKTAFYDRSAHMFLRTRYSFRSGIGEERYVRFVTDWDGTIIHRPKSSSNDIRGWIEGEEKCMEWLDANKPEWRNPLAYWDEAS